MEINAYADSAATFALFQEDKSGLDYLTSSLPEEVGELSGIFAKCVRNGRGRDLTEDELKRARSELGDVLWNVALLARCLGTDLETVARNNIAKLSERKIHGKIEGNGETIHDR